MTNEEKKEIRDLASEHMFQILEGTFKQTKNCLNKWDCIDQAEPFRMLSQNFSYFFNLAADQFKKQIEIYEKAGLMHITDRNLQ